MEPMITTRWVSRGPTTLTKDGTNQFVLDSMGHHMSAFPSNVSQTGIFHALFALFFPRLTIIISQILSYQTHYTRFIPFRLLTLFTDNKENTCIEPIT